MTKVFTGTPKFDGISDDHVRVAAVGGLVLIHAIDGVHEKATTIVMTPEQARALAQGIIDAADNAEAGE